MPKRRTPSIVIPSRWSNSTEEPTTSNTCGRMLDAHAAVLRDADQVEHVGRRAGRQRDDHAMDVVALDRGPDEVRRARPRMRGRASRSIDATTAALRRLEAILLLDRLEAARCRRPRGSARSARPGARPSGRRRARSAAVTKVANHSEQRRCRPAGRWRGEAVEREPEHQHVQAGDLEQGRRLVERGLLEHQLVALVQAGDLVDEHDHRRGGEQEQRRDRVGRQRQRRGRSRTRRPRCRRPASARRER